MQTEDSAGSSAANPMNPVNVGDIHFSIIHNIVYYNNLLLILRHWQTFQDCLNVHCVGTLRKVISLLDLKYRCALL